MTDMPASDSENEGALLVPPRSLILEEEDQPIVTDDLYVGISTLAVTEKQEMVLSRPVELGKVDITPMGEVYAGQVEYRRVLCEAFHPAGWAMRPVSKPVLHGDWLIQNFALYVEGRYISSAYGEAQYFPSNDRMSYATALESLKSVALRRVCKDLGIFTELWDRGFVRKFIKEHCVEVEYINSKGKVVKGWRRTEAVFEGEALLKEFREKARNGKQPLKVDPDLKKAAEDLGGKVVESKPAPEPVLSTEGVLSYRTTSSGIKEVSINGAWRVASEPVGAVSAQSREKIVKLFGHEKHLDNYLQLYFKKTTLAALTWEELAALFADKKDARRDGRWFPEGDTVDWNKIQVEHQLTDQAITDLETLVKAGTLVVGSEMWNKVLAEADRVPL